MNFKIGDVIYWDVFWNGDPLYIVVDQYKVVNLISLEMFSINISAVFWHHHE